MKKCVIIFILMLSNMVIFSGCEKQVETIEKKSVERVYVEKNSDIINSMIKHIGLAEETLENFGFTDSEGALEFWAQGIIKRNGVMQYTVMNKNLKNDFKNYLALHNNTSWITGDDNVEVVDYKILNTNALSDKIIIYRVKFHLVFEDKEEDREVNVTLTQEDENWVIESILM